jgi:hypothetical protein
MTSSQGSAKASEPDSGLEPIGAGTLVVGIDRWYAERLIEGDFFWFANPFGHSKSCGFIAPQKRFSLRIPCLLAVDLADAAETDPLSFDPASTIFYSESWSAKAASVASFVRNIVMFRGGKRDVVKKDFIIQEFRS